MRSILCPVEKSTTLDDRVETALALARETKGHVAFQIATPFAQIATWAPFGGAIISADAVNDAREADEAFARDLEARLAPQDVPFDVSIIDGGYVEAAAAAARFADVIVASLGDPGIEELVLSVRCPVLALPRGRPMLAFDAPVLIAWDGGHESANALRAALPLLAKAKTVHLLTVREKADAFPAADAASYLSRHDIHAEVHRVEREGSIAVTVQECASRVGAGLIVMGLFGHSRLRELLIGGVSREMLDRSQIPLLLAH